MWQEFERFGMKTPCRYSPLTVGMETAQSIIEVGSWGGDKLDFFEFEQNLGQFWVKFGLNLGKSWLNQC